MTFESDERLLLIWFPSVKRWPVVPASFAFSEPAKSTRFCTPDDQDSEVKLTDAAITIGAYQGFHNGEDWQVWRWKFS